MNYKKNKYKYIVLIVVVILAIVIGFTASSVREDKKLNFFEKAVKDTVNFIGNIVYAPIDYVKGKIELNKEKDYIYKKYKDYDEEKKKEDSYLATIDELKSEIGELKTILELNSVLSDYTCINATVINRNVGYWYNTLTIDKGSKDNIKEGMAVVVNEGLIGRVVKVSNYSSTVKLLTTDDLSNKISVKINIDGKSVYGLLSSYDIDKNLYTVEGISDSDKIEKNSYVTTTGLSEMFPSGILVGSVKNVVVDKYDLTKVVEVTPAVDFNNITYVTVLKREAN